jgi:cell filamentation protein, protein adenylyltransferase
MDPKEFKSPESGRVIRTKTGYWAFLPAALPPALTWSAEMVLDLSEAERELSKLSTLARNMPFPRLLSQPFMRQEAVLSSRIEGTRASLEDVYRYESAQLSFLEREGDVREVYNYVRALDYGLKRLDTLPVSLRLIREIHERLLEDVRGGSLTPGKFRRTQNWIGPGNSTLADATFIPPPVEEMQAALNSLEKFIHSDAEVPVLARAGMIHYQFEAIHPFLDGNGRVGRLLIMLLLCQWKLLPEPLMNLSAYFERYRQEYYDHLLAVSRSGKWEAWLRFFFRGISTQARDSVRRATHLQGIRATYDQVVQSDRNPQRMAEVVDLLFARPILTARQVAAGLNMPFKTAGQYIDKLERAGILREITGYARNRIYQADEILRAVQGIA